ncbi:ClpXP protease specificity-enhancing factor SspB [Sutterella sp.]|uniref:ClpXP protease specificity-enhancing factor SspB n=1 Tax=Sutterella sp. TaxID=1981025 RepID=UPI0026DEEDFC|nr:ClpXP protease specificity-enhancing factor SspB [Sutterella sp.]MDO5531289.1 ClpXP protease specificity-enhancing factor SspB [Sutterella sp.]
MDNLKNLRARCISTVLEYCYENGFRPYVWVEVDAGCVVPQEFVQEGMIIFDLDGEAVRNQVLDDDLLRFEARFGDDPDPMEVVVPVCRIVHVAPVNEVDEGASFQTRPTPPELVARATGKEPVIRRPMRIK